MPARSSALPRRSLQVSAARRPRPSTCSSRSPTAEPVLSDVGLDHDGVLAALTAERDRSLRAVGISASDFDLPPAPLARPRFAASSKLALERALRAAVARSDRRIAGGHILLGVLAAEAGTVPRALDIAGIDRQELRDRAAASLN